MENNVPLTSEEAAFAEKNHNLVYKFLHDNDLRVDEFYDVVIFAYLRAVKRFFAEPDLKNYAFSTIAFRMMRFEYLTYLRSLRSKKHTADVISLHAMDDNIPNPHAADDLLHEVEEQLLLHELAARVSRQQMDILRLRHSGYHLTEIAGRCNITVKCVKQQLNDVRILIMDICQN